MGILLTVRRSQSFANFVLHHKKDEPPVPPKSKIWTDGNLNKIVDGNGKNIVFKVNP